MAIHDKKEYIGMYHLGKNFDWEKVSGQEPPCYIQILNSPKQHRMSERIHKFKVTRKIRTPSHKEMELKSGVA